MDRIWEQIFTLRDGITALIFREGNNIYTPPTRVSNLTLLPATRFRSAPGAAGIIAKGPAVLALQPFSDDQIRKLICNSTSNMQSKYIQLQTPSMNKTPEIPILRTGCDSKRHITFSVPFKNSGLSAAPEMKLDLELGVRAAADAATRLIKSSNDIMRAVH